MSAKRFELEHFVAFKLIEGLYKKGIVDKETFENVKAEYPEFFQKECGELLFLRLRLQSHHL